MPKFVSYVIANKFVMLYAKICCSETEHKIQGFSYVICQNLLA